MTRLTLPFLPLSLSLPLSIASAKIAGQRRMKKSKRKAIENKSLIAPAGKIKLLNQLCQRCCHWEIALKGVYLGVGRGIGEGRRAAYCGCQRRVSHARNSHANDTHTHTQIDTDRHW